MRRILTVLMIVALIGAMGGPACLPRHTSTGESTSGDKRGAGLIKLNVRLAWQANANSAGQIVALARGFYQEEGLDVTFHEGGMDEPPVKAVSAGADDLGFANGPYSVIAARASGVPLKIVSVIHREGYHCFCARKDSGIQSPKDWQGRRVGVKPSGSPTYFYYLAILKKLGIDRATISEVPVRFDVRPFLAGEVDVFPGAKNNEAISIEDHGIRLTCLTPEEYGIPTMGHVLFTTEAMLRERGDVVRRFVRATMRGWEWCRRPENLDATIDLLVNYNHRLEGTKEKRALKQAILVVGDGSIDKDKLNSIIDTQLRYGDLSTRVAADEVTAPIPTN